MTRGPQGEGAALTGSHPPGRAVPCRDLRPRAGRAGQRPHSLPPASARGKPRRGRAGIRPQGLCSRGRGGSLLVPQPDRGPRAEAAPRAPAASPTGPPAGIALPAGPRCPAACPRPPCGDSRCTWPRHAPATAGPRLPPHAGESGEAAGKGGTRRAHSGGARRRERAQARTRPGRGGGGRAAGRGRARPVCERESEGRAIPGRRKAAAAAASLGSGQASGHRRCRAGRYGGRCDSGHPSSSSPPPARPSPFSFSPSPLSAGADRSRRHNPGAFPRRLSRQRPRGEPALPLPGRD